jgi:hypothetical protein
MIKRVVATILIVNANSVTSGLILIFKMYDLAMLFNMKQARPWMLTNLKIMCQFHAHPVY